MALEDDLRSLSKIEAKCLYHTCKDLTYEQVGNIVGLGRDRVQQHMTSAYNKLRIFDPTSAAKREKLDKLKVCEALNSLIENNTDNLERFPLPPRVTEEAIPLPRRRSILPLFLALLIPLALYLGVLYGRRQGEPQVIVITATAPLSSPTAPVSPTVAVPVVLPSDTSIPPEIPTETPTQTSVVEPTASETLTSVPFVPPADGILFQDNFDESMSPEWNTFGNGWFISGGKLTKLTTSDTSAYQWIALNNPEWKNYILSVDISKPRDDDVVIAVRNNTSKSQLIGAEVNTYEVINLVLISNFYYDNTFIAGDSETYVQSDLNVQIEVQGDIYILRGDGREIQRITLAGYDSGGISLGVKCQIDDFGCTTFDNVKVTYLP